MSVSDERWATLKVGRRPYYKAATRPYAPIKTYALTPPQSHLGENIVYYVYVCCLCALLLILIALDQCVNC